MFHSQSILYIIYHLLNASKNENTAKILFLSRRTMNTLQHYNFCSTSESIG